MMLVSANNMAPFTHLVADSDVVNMVNGLGKVYRDRLSRIQQSGAIQSQADVWVDLLGRGLRLHCRQAQPHP